MSTPHPEYKNLITQLFAVNWHGGMKLGLSNMLQLNEALGKPIQCYQSIHVAGSNGKGSVVTKIAAGLQAEGYRVGLFTSPHISTFRERITVNGLMIDEMATVELLQHLFELIKTLKISATFFEITTALAFMYFAKQKVDFAVIETGLGGRLDATNILHPILTIITSISLEHQEFLGNTIEEITKEKAGIIKPEVPLIIGPCVSLDLIKNLAQNFKSLLYQVLGPFKNYHEENQAIAKKALELLNVSEHSIIKGLKKLPPCRLEIVKENPWVILDVGHNPDGLEHLFQAIDQKFPGVKRRVIFGLSKNKDIEGCLLVIKQRADYFHLVAAPNGRGLDVNTLYQKMQEIHFDLDKVFLQGTISQTIDAALEAATVQKELLIICGTFFIMSEARASLGISEPKDPFDTNERAK